MASGAGNLLGGILGGVLTGGAGPAIGAGLQVALPGIAETAKILVDRLVPDPNAKAAAQLEVEKTLAAREIAAIQAGAEIAKAQAETNTAEAQNPSTFIGGWRPAVGWVCAIGLLYTVLVQPLLAWVTGIAGVAIGAAIPPPPIPAGEVLLTLITGMLGIAGLRSYDKVKGTAAAELTPR